MNYHRSPILPARRMFDFKKLKSTFSNLKKLFKREKKVSPSLSSQATLCETTEKATSQVESLPASPAKKTESKREKKLPTTSSSDDYDQSMIFTEAFFWPPPEVCEKEGSDNDHDQDVRRTRSSFWAEFHEEGEEDEEDDEYYTPLSYAKTRSQKEGALLLRRYLSEDFEVPMKEVQLIMRASVLSKKEKALLSKAKAARDAEKSLISVDPITETRSFDDKETLVESTNGVGLDSVPPGFEKSMTSLNKETCTEEEVEEKTEDETALTVPIEVQFPSTLTTPEDVAQPKPQDNANSEKNPTKPVGFNLQAWIPKSWGFSAIQKEEEKDVVSPNESSTQILSEAKPIAQLDTSEQDTGVELEELKTTNADADKINHNLSEEGSDDRTELELVPPPSPIDAHAIAINSVDAPDIQDTETNVDSPSNETDVVVGPEPQSSIGWESFLPQKNLLARIFPFMEDKDKSEVPETQPVLVEPTKSAVQLYMENLEQQDPSIFEPAHEPCVEHPIDTIYSASALAIVQNEGFCLPDFTEESTRDELSEFIKKHRGQVDQDTPTFDDQKTLTNNSVFEPCSPVETLSSPSCVYLDESEVVHAKSFLPCDMDKNSFKELDTDNEHVAQIKSDLAPTSDEPVPNRDHSVAVVDGDHSSTSAGRLEKSVKNSTEQEIKSKLVGILKKCFRQSFNKRFLGQEKQTKIPVHAVDTSSTSSIESEANLDKVVSLSKNRNKLNDSPTGKSKKKISFGQDEIAYYQKGSAPFHIIPDSVSPSTLRSRENYALYSHMKVFGPSIGSEYHRGRASVGEAPKVPVSILKIRNPHYRWEKLYIKIFSWWLR